MAYKLSITEKSLSINCNVRYENLSKRERPSVEAKSTEGKPVKERSIFNGSVLPPGSTQRKWVDDDGNVYTKDELTFWFEGEQVEEIQMTKVLDIDRFEPLTFYTDRYVMDKFYELFPDNNGMKKDLDRQMAERGNLVQMRKLWEHLNANGVVGRGEFNVSSKGFVAGDGYVRAINIEGKWGLEIGVFKEEKIFQHLNEGIPTAINVDQAKTKTRKLKMV